MFPYPVGPETSQMVRINQRFFFRAMGARRSADGAHCRRDSMPEVPALVSHRLDL